jgi:hypothetical protein
MLAQGGGPEGRLVSLMPSRPRSNFDQR